MSIFFLPFFSRHRNNSIACLRAKAQEHQARLLNSGLLLQVRSLAGLQNPLSHSPPHSCDSNANTLHGSAGPQSSPHSPHDSPSAAPNSIDSRSFHHLSHHHSPANMSPAATVKSEHSAGINMAFWYSQPIETRIDRNQLPNFSWIEWIKNKKCFNKCKPFKFQRV